MSGAKKRPVNNTGKNKSSRGLLVIVSISVVLIISYLGFKNFRGGNEKSVSTGGDLTIPKSEVSETAKFYPYKVGKTKMEVMAVKASDGTIRTAFNTCQICYASGRGYYVQEGDEMVCQNCGNRFQLDKIEIIKGGCNPVPIMDENKTDDGTNIVISKDFLSSNKDLFNNWGKQ